ncbi:MAG: glutamine--fructose-6-phosphate transaminase (isomerizing) [Clostridia bacterium]|nr:glutamine--fructose-6-phosphate transaminase (isomerizing) [Clostridia bacterium]
MCGIVGYIGSKSAENVLISGLRRLEYRGYDSCGIATIHDGKFAVSKTTKRIDDLESNLKEDVSTIGIGHTRWATHGAATIANAHPHVSNSEKFIVVHNGIIENYVALKELLKEKGFQFYSDTDTEVIPNLIEMNYDGDLLKAVKKTTDMLEGSFALGILDKDDSSTLVATRRNSPLIIGVGEGENFIASDFSAIVKYTNQIDILENDQFAVLKKDEVDFYDNDLKEYHLESQRVDISDEDIEKNGYSHYMLKEIHENTSTIKNTLDHYISGDQICFDLQLSEEELENIQQIHIVACGTATHAGLNGKNIIEKLARIPVNVVAASEFRYQNPILSPNDLVIFISQSGETADTIASIELVKERGVKFLSIVNVPNSTIDRMSENVLFTKAGPEIAVASTKAYVAQVCVLDLFAIFLADKLHRADRRFLQELLDELKNIHTKVEMVLEEDDQYLAYAKKIVGDKDIFYLGRGVDYYTAQEGSLKLKEISYIHSEAMQLGELKHGSIALMEKGIHTIVLCTEESLVGKVISNIKEIKARDAEVLLVSNLNITEEVYDDMIHLPAVNELLSPIVAVIPLQLIAYHVAVLKNLDVDKPRNLAKSVTVE